ncbi:MAG: HAD family hydrolase [Chthoniobacterales bacterium]|jgi:phosphoglycolate phosphatase-like HAD superfamily hydrolase
MAKKLILFDIDGTLLLTGRAGEHALRSALRERFGVEDDLSGISFAGSTDGAIVRQMFAAHNIEATPENIADLLDGYVHNLPHELPRRDGRILPGIVALLDALKARPDAVLGLLTGNIERGAEIKLSHYGVWDYFEFGAYADDHVDRNKLGPVAQARALERHGMGFAAEDIFVLGDTPKDIDCARAAGFWAVAIATGGSSREELAAHRPDFLFEDLSDTAAVLAMLFGASSASA